MFLLNAPFGKGINSSSIIFEVKSEHTCDFSVTISKEVSVSSQLILLAIIRTSSCKTKLFMHKAAVKNQSNTSQSYRDKLPYFSFVLCFRWPHEIHKNCVLKLCFTQNFWQKFKVTLLHQILWLAPYFNLACEQIKWPAGTIYSSAHQCLANTWSVYGSLWTSNCCTAPEESQLKFLRQEE